ncbi:DegT/DnrJ/EryC1/StrS aminotransferase family protein [Emticicia sp. C21]|uniref:DegT/DnrJ/EryC1/StrS family aminotransferase n=1 Tax=Emticicia sp. C21 TaxID=2302915 RepID=UPI000E350D4D|nr:DegT/DnrJ/EryC1/StrS family aminotransferase [Emticicia sp. C21]RFS17243.1 DegT/DnrJ/EryC1/StrS family aminotransferase [Emticicia sp. C21]
MKIQMVDLKGQYEKIKYEIDNAILNCINTSQFIKGPVVAEFQEELERYLGVKYVITCGNGTDALQIALMALDLQPGDEVIIPAFTYAATAEVIGLLRLTPVLVDINKDSFNIDIKSVENAITPKTKAIIPVHLFGQGADMESLLKIAEEKNIFIVEDAAQAIGASYIFSNGDRKRLGTIGAIGCTSFFPSKNLGCYGDGGALMTNDPLLAEKIRSIANHGQQIQYIHDIIGVNSRLDAIQAGILLPKLARLDEYNKARIVAADYYDENLKAIEDIIVPFRLENSTHVFHQYTIKVKNGSRDKLKDFLKSKGIPSMIYYPKPLHHQSAYMNIINIKSELEYSENIPKEVLSLPIHTELDSIQQDFIINAIKEFFHK